MTRLLFLDMEGTLLRKERRLDDGLVAPSAWTLLAERLGPECLDAENKTKHKWNDNGYGGCYLDWMQETIDIHKTYGLTREIFYEVVDSVELMPGAKAALDKIHELGYITVLITGGFKAHADRVQGLLNIRHSFAACEYFFDTESGRVQYANLLPADEVGKVDFMRLMCREYKAETAHCAFVGDGKNDIHLAKEVGFSIAFNGQPELCAVVTECINQAENEEDFFEVAKLLEKHLSMDR